MHQCYTEKKFDKCIKLCNQLFEEFDGQMTKYYEMWI